VKDRWTTPTRLTALRTSSACCSNAWSALLEEWHVCRRPIRAWYTRAP